MSPKPPKLEEEIELKFDIPPTMKGRTALSLLAEIAAEKGWKLESQTEVKRHFVYFDTPNLDLYRKGMTLRRISGYDPSHSKGQWRYDFKEGPTTDRREGNHWSSVEIPDEQLMELFKDYVTMDQIVRSAHADGVHKKMVLVRKGSVLEAKYDRMDVWEGTRVREMELEIKKGTDVEGLRLIGELFHQRTGLNYITVQKYARIIEGMERYNGIRTFPTGHPDSPIQPGSSF